MTDALYFVMDDSTRLLYYTLVFAFLLIFSMRDYARIKVPFTSISLTSIKKLILISVTGLALRLAYGKFQAISGVSIWSHRKSAILISESHAMSPALDTKGYDLLLSPIYSLTGDISLASHSIDIAFGVFSIIAIFFLTYVLFRDENAALLSSSVLAILPWHIFFSGTHGIEIAATFFSMLALMFIYIASESEYPKNQSLSLYFLAFIAILFTALVRKEQIFLLTVLILWFLWSFWINAKDKNLKQINPAQALICLAASVILLIPYISDIMIENFYENQVSAANIQSNVLAVFSLLKYNYILAILVIGPVFLYIRNRDAYRAQFKPIAYLMLWIICISVPFMLHKDMNTRYYIFFAIPYIMFVSFSISSLSKELTKFGFRLFILSVSLLIAVSSVLIISACSTNAECRYLTPQPLRWQDSKMDEIYMLFNSSEQDKTHIIFLDPQSKNSFISTHRDFPRGNVHCAWSEDISDSQGYLDFMYPGNIYPTGSEIYLVQFGEDYMYECSQSYHYEQFCDLMDNYYLAPFHDDDLYSISRLVLQPISPISKPAETQTSQTSSEI